MILKTNLHFHSKNDDRISSYDIREGIDFAKSKNFDVLAYTPHRKFLVRKEYIDYAANKGILLIPGTEIQIEGRHIVMLNCSKEVENIKSFKELGEYKNNHPESFIIAPHPYILSSNSLLGRRLIENMELFDAIEMSVFSNALFNFNKKAEKTAEKYDKPFIATSDTHFFKDIERGYALINAGEKTAERIFQAIRNKNFQNKMNSMSPFAMLELKIKGSFNTARNYISGSKAVL